MSVKLVGFWLFIYATNGMNTIINESISCGDTITTFINETSTLYSFIINKNTTNIGIFYTCGNRNEIRTILAIKDGNGNYIKSSYFGHCSGGTDLSYDLAPYLSGNETDIFYLYIQPYYSDDDIGTISLTWKCGSRYYPTSSPTVTPIDDISCGQTVTDRLHNDVKWYTFTINNSTTNTGMFDTCDVITNIRNIIAIYKYKNSGYIGSTGVGDCSMSYDLTDYLSGNSSDVFYVLVQPWSTVDNGVFGLTRRCGSPNAPTSPPTPVSNEISTEYVKVNIPMTYMDAEQYCNEQYNAPLAVIWNNKQNRKVMKLCGDDYPCWIGYRAISTYDSFWKTWNTEPFSWIDGSNNNYSKWSDYYDSNPLTTYDNCAAITQDHGVWKAYNCFAEIPTFIPISMNFVCGNLRPNRHQTLIILIMFSSFMAILCIVFIVRCCYILKNKKRRDTMIGNAIELDSISMENKYAPMEAFTVDTQLETDIKSTRCCFGRIKSYPMFWPRLYILQTFGINILLIYSLTTDILFFIQSLKPNKDYIDTSSGWWGIPFVTTKENLARFIFTFAPGIVITVFVYFVADRKKTAKCINNNFCFMLLLFVFGFLYKIIMIGLSIFRMIFVLDSWYLSVVPLSIFEFNRQFDKIFLMEAVTSGWPLWVLSLVLLQDYYHKNSLDLSQVDTILLFVKVVSSGLLIFLNIDKFRIWNLSDYAKYGNVIILRSKNNNDAPMRIIHVNNDSNIGVLSCIECKENILDKRYRENAYFHCDSIRYDYNLCIKCGWKYITEYQKRNNITDGDLTASMTKEMKLLYQDNFLMDNVLVENKENINNDKELALINENSKCINKSLFPKREYKSVLKKRFDGFIILLTCSLMIKPFYHVWINRNTIHLYSSNYYLVDSTLFIFIALILRILIIIELIISFIISRLLNKSQSLKILIRWSINFNYVFYLFGFFMIFPCWNIYWKFGTSSQISMILWCIIVIIALLYTLYMMKQIVNKLVPKHEYEPKKDDDIIEENTQQIKQKQILNKMEQQLKDSDKLIKKAEVIIKNSDKISIDNQ